MKNKTYMKNFFTLLVGTLLLLPIKAGLGTDKKKELEAKFEKNLENKLYVHESGYSCYYLEDTTDMEGLKTIFKNNGCEKYIEAFKFHISIGRKVEEDSDTSYIDEVPQKDRKKELQSFIKEFSKVENPQITIEENFGKPTNPFVVINLGFTYKNCYLNNKKEIKFKNSKAHISLYNQEVINDIQKTMTDEEKLVEGTKLNKLILDLNNYLTEKGNNFFTSVKKNFFLSSYKIFFNEFNEILKTNNFEINISSLASKNKVSFPQEINELNEKFFPQKINELNEKRKLLNNIEEKLKEKLDIPYELHDHLTDNNFDIFVKIFLTRIFNILEEKEEIKKSIKKKLINTLSDLQDLINIFFSSTEIDKEDLKIIKDTEILLKYCTEELNKIKEKGDIDEGDFCTLSEIEKNFELKKKQNKTKQKESARLLTEAVAKIPKIKSKKKNKGTEVYIDESGLIHETSKLHGYS